MLKMSGKGFLFGNMERGLNFQNGIDLALTYGRCCSDHTGHPYSQSNFRPPKAGFTID